MRKRILVTGAFGQLGHAVLKIFPRKFDVLATDCVVPATNPTDYSLGELDITDPDDCQLMIEEYAPDVILNMASMTNVDQCEKHPEQARRINAEGVGNLLKFFSGYFVQISTDYVFNGRNGPYSENAKVDPVNVYGRTKYSAERLVGDQAKSGLIVRTNVVFDYHARTQASFVKWVVDSLKAGKSIQVVDDQWNNPTWTESLAETLVVLIDRNETGVVNVAGADYLNRFEFAEMIGEVFDLDTSTMERISTVELGQLAPRPKKGGLKTQLIESKFGLSPASLRHCLETIRDRI